MSKEQLTAVIFEGLKDKGFTPAPALHLARTLANTLPLDIPEHRGFLKKDLRDIAEVLQDVAAVLK